MANSQGVDAAIASLALLPTDELRESAGEVAEGLGPAAVAEVLSRLKGPTVTADQAGADPKFKFEWPRKWTASVLELLGAFGLEGAAPLWLLLDDPNDSIAQRAMIVLLRMPMAASEPAREQLLAELRQRLPKFYRKDVPLYPIISSVLTESRKEPRLLEVLSALSELVLLDAKKKKFVLGDMARDILQPPSSPAKPAEPAEHKALASNFADAIVARNIGAAHELLSPPLQKHMTPRQLETELAAASKHSGWPVSYEEPTFSQLRADQLRGRVSKHEPSLPKAIKDEEFRNWMWILFLPSDDSDSDFVFNLGVALVDSAGELRVGSYWISEED